MHVNQSELPTQRVAEEHVTCCTYEQILLPQINHRSKRLLSPEVKFPQKEYDIEGGWCTNWFNWDNVKLHFGDSVAKSLWGYKLFCGI